jgi:cbb3-type cytochrome oxidase maturation protein
VVLAPIEAVHAYIAITVAALGIVAIWLSFLVWGWRSGQFDDIEATKYRVFEDDVPGAERRVPGAEDQTRQTRGNP